jgi:hypothetical protein
MPAARVHTDAQQRGAIENPWPDRPRVGKQALTRWIASVIFAEETKPVSTGTEVRAEDRFVLRVFVLIRLTHFC